MNTFTKSGLGLIGGAVFAVAPLFAQKDKEAGGDIFELSPFVVDAANDQGYRAQNTLSGTRLNSSLTDVGASISVMTKDLLDDIGATDITDAFLYSTNTENEDEYASDDTEGISITTTNSNRVRGLASSTYSRGFFTTNVRGDSYNIERFTMAYGPNAILYGLGSPAGIVDSSSKRASLGKDFGEFGFRFDNNGSQRYTFDYNKVLLDDKLAIRVATMTQEKQSWKKPDVDDETRFFGTITSKPFENTTIRYSYESMKNLRSKGRSQMGNQSVKTWIENGMPLYDHINDRLTFDEGASWQAAPASDAELYALGIDRGPISNFRVQINSGDELASGAWSSIADPATRALYEENGLQALRWNGTAQSTGRSVEEAKDDPLAIDELLPRDYSISGLANFADLRADTHSIVWEQKLAHNLFFEMAFNQEIWTQHAFDPIRGENTLKADVNYYLPAIVLPYANGGDPFYPNDPTRSTISDTNLNQSGLVLDANGDPVMVRNPNAGNYYVDGRGIGYDGERRIDTLRFTASYELDLTERSKWFGKHSIALLYQAEDNQELASKTRHFNDENSYVQSPSHNNNDIQQRYYIDPPKIGGNGAARSAYPIGFSTADSDSWSSIVGTKGQTSATLREIEGAMAVVQNRWLGNRLITTLGFRKDSEDTYQYLRPNNDSPPFDQSFTSPPSDLTYPSISGDTKTTGAVFKANDWLKVFYNKSDSFQPQSNLHDYFNNPIPPADGEGEDVGFMIDMLEGKLFVRASWYNQTATGALELDWTYEIMKWRLASRIEGYIEQWAAVLPQRPEWAAQLGISPDDVRETEISDNIRSIRDFKSEGMEIELIAKPIEGLDLRLTFAKNESINTRTLPNLQAYVNDRLPTWEKYALLPNAPGNAARVPSPSDPSKDKIGGKLVNGNATTAPLTRGQILGNSQSIGYHMYVLDTGLSRLEFAKQEEGSASARARKYRANFIANYRFSEGRFKGFGIGTGIRYRSKGAIGYESKPNPFMAALLEEEPDLASLVTADSLLTADITKPIYGKESVDIDAWIKYQRKISVAGRNLHWRIQVNIANLLDEDDLEPRSTNNDGTIKQYNLRAPRTIALTNTFKF